MAHIGGFVAGAVLVWFFKKKTVRVFAAAESRAFSVEKRRIHKPQMCIGHAAGPLSPHPPMPLRRAMVGIP